MCAPPPPQLTAPTQIYFKRDPACVHSNVYNSTSAPNVPNISARAPLCKYKSSLANTVSPSHINIYYPPVMGKHPDFMVAHPTPTIFRPLVEIFEISYFFAKNFEKVYTKTSTRRPTFGRNLPKVVNFGEKKTSRP